MHPIIEKHGKQLISELLDIIFIHEGKLKTQAGRDLLVKHKIVTKGTKYVSTWYGVMRVTHETLIEDGYPYRRRVPLEVPYKEHRIYFKNGSNQVKLDVRFKDIDIPQIMEELRNEAE